MSVHLEVHLDRGSDESFVHVLCEVVPRVGERIRLFTGGTAESGLYLVREIEHILDPRRHEDTQHVCVLELYG